MRIDYSLYLIVDDSLCLPSNMPQLVASLVDCGVTCVQLRMKCSPIETVENISQTLLNLLRVKKIPLIINNDIEIAADINADGVHIGQKDRPYSKTREYLGYKKIIGLSIENIQQAQKFRYCDADYFGVGPIFPTSTKHDAASPIGIQDLQKITQILKKPVIAIGGINRKNINLVLETGVSGIAFVSAILSAKQPALETRKLSNIISIYQERSGKN